MSNARRVNYSFAEYLDVEEHSEVRHEFFDGEVYAMAGGTPEHGALAFRVGQLLAASLVGCTPLTSDVRIFVSASNLTTYPDLSFVCGPAVRSPHDRFAVVNPAVLVEVTSPSTEAYDRGAKLSHYQRIPSLEAVLFFSHADPRITVVERTDAGWRSTDFGPGELAAFERRKVSLSVDAVYEVLTALNGA